MMSKGNFSSKKRNVFLQSDMIDLKKNGKIFFWKLYRCSSTPLILSTSDSWYGNLRVRSLTVCSRRARRVLSSYNTRSAPPITLAMETSAAMRMFNWRWLPTQRIPPLSCLLLYFSLRWRTWAGISHLVVLALKFPYLLNWDPILRLALAFWV